MLDPLPPQLPAGVMVLLFSFIDNTNLSVSIHTKRSPTCCAIASGELLLHDEIKTTSFICWTAFLKSTFKVLLSLPATAVATVSHNPAAVNTHHIANTAVFEIFIPFCFRL